MTFREWLEIWIETYGKLEARNIEPEVTTKNAFEECLKEFDWRFRIASFGELARSTGTLWIEEEQDDE